MANQEPTTYSNSYIDHGCAYFAAVSADEQWQRELDFQNIDRYSLDAKGTTGSALRLLYDKKLRADEDLRAATDALRLNGRTNEILTLV